jgi:trimethylamine--corrinoid protein Co-methyltransferase
MGGTGPAAFAGGLVASNAEMMSGIVLVQLLNPGLGTIANCFVFPQNMWTGAPGFGQIGISIFQAGYTQMWRAKYGLPTLLGACGPMASKQPDAQFGYEKGIACVIGSLCGGTIINAIGGLHGELTYHPAVSVLDNDMAGMIGRFLEGMKVNHETLAIDLIEKVGPIPGWTMPRRGWKKSWTTTSTRCRKTRRKSWIESWKKPGNTTGKRGWLSQSSRRNCDGVLRGALDARRGYAPRRKPRADWQIDRADYQSQSGLTVNIGYVMVDPPLVR